MKQFESFESNRWIWRINLALQVLLVFALGGIVNYIGLNTYTRLDLTERRAFSLSPETLGYIRELPSPVEIIVTLTPNNEDEGLAQAYRDVRGILREYEYAARANKADRRIRVSFLNVFEQRNEAEKLGIRKEDAVVFRSGDRERMVMTDELYRSHNRLPSEFEGERSFTSSMIEVSSGDRPVLYFVAGHGEMLLDNTDPVRGASQLNLELQARGFRTEVINLSARRRVPDNAAMVIVLSPRNAFLRAEREILREYLASGRGRLLLALDPIYPHGLEELLLDWGVLVDDTLVIEASPDYRVASGDTLIKHFARHPVTQVFIDNQVSVLLGSARTVRADEGRPLEASLEVTELMATSKVSWGEFNYTSRTAQFNADKDIPGPVTVAVVAERKVDSGLGVNIQGARLIVFGSSSFLPNDRLGVLGNQTLFLNSINWALGRNSRLNIPARPVDRLKLNLSEKQLTLTRVTLLFGPALLAGVVGMLVTLSRRR